MNRRQFLGATSLLTTGLLTNFTSGGRRRQIPVPSALRRRSVDSPARPSRPKSAASRRPSATRELAWMFENCFPNTLDTTVDFTVKTAGRTPTSSRATLTPCGSATARARSGPICR